MRFKVKLSELIEPVRTRLSYKDEPKVRGVIPSTLIAIVTWLVAANIPALIMYLGYLVLVSSAQVYNQYEAGRDVGPTLRPFLSVYACMYGAMLFFDGIRGTGIVCYYCCRTWPSIIKSVMFAIFAKRHSSGTSPQFIVIPK